jgi:hypothetical protein
MRSYPLTTADVPESTETAPRAEATTTLEADGSASPTVPTAAKDSEVWPRAWALFPAE